VKYTYLFVVLAMLASACSRTEKTDVSLVPFPAHLEVKNGQFELQSGTQLVVVDNEKFGGEVDQLQQLMQKALGQSLSTEKGANSIEILQSDTFSVPEAYAITITSKKISLAAGDAAGIFYAIETLRQLLPPSVEDGEHSETRN